MRPMSDEAAADFRGICAEEERRWQAEMALLCRTLTENVRHWWE